MLQIGNGSSEQHPHIPVLAKKTDITVGGNMKALNYVFGGEIATDDPQMQDKRSEVKITVEKNCIIGTLPINHIMNNIMVQFCGS